MTAKKAGTHSSLGVFISENAGQIPRANLSKNQSQSSS